MITAILFLTERELTQAKRNRFRNTEVEFWKAASAFWVLKGTAIKLLCFLEGSL
jgi:hypothetical protein